MLLDEESWLIFDQFRTSFTVRFECDVNNPREARIGQRRVAPASNAIAGPLRRRCIWWAGAVYQPLVPPYIRQTCKIH